MIEKEAYDIICTLHGLGNLSEEERFSYTEALKFLIEEFHDPKDMMYLGEYYYELREFDLALKYYEMAATYDYDWAYVWLGYVWYYGRTGTIDYEKAFDYFSKVMEKGNLVATYKVADMYKNGYFVEKNQTTYEAMIEDLYSRVKDTTNYFEPLPEVFTRLARIRISQDKLEEAVELYLKAKDVLAQRIDDYAPFFWNLNIMKWLVNDLYELVRFDESEMDLYDLYYFLKEEHHVAAEYHGSMYHIESVKEESAMQIHFYCEEIKLDEWYYTIEDFFKKALMEDERIVCMYYDLIDWEVF